MLFFSACSDDDDANTDQLNCTADFQFVTIEVIGDTLTDFFTLRQSNGDTIRHEDQYLPFELTYIVLTDNFRDELQNTQENFIFKGFIEDSLVVEEPFEIGAGRCHIAKVSGKDKVQL